MPCAILTFLAVQAAPPAGEASTQVHCGRDLVRAADWLRLAPSAGIIDSQSVKGADTVGRDSRGYDAVLSAYLTSPIRFVFADGGFAGKLVDWATTLALARRVMTASQPRAKRNAQIRRGTH